MIRSAKNEIMKKLSFLALALVFAMGGCKSRHAAESTGPVQHVEWSRRATIYEVNIRQYTPEGTFKAFGKELPRLQKMGVDLLWLMPVNPVGIKNRKGSLGSYYSVRDYLAVNPEYGTKQDLADLVRKAHALGMKVILDWVANHTSWDNPLITQHPEWYKKDSTGKITPPVPDWTDVAALDYTKPELRKYMTEALLYWIREADVDGFRCDVAGMLPVSFWHEAIPELQRIKPVFMLAEEEKPAMHDTGYFDMTYSWDIYHLMNDIYKGTKTADNIDTLLTREAKQYPKDAYRMRFITNHDENSWNGTEYERLGDGVKAFTILTYTLPGMPLIYSGQESALNKRLRFFDKDTIVWGDYPLASFYTTLNQLKKKNRLLAAGEDGGEFIKVATTNDQAVYTFLRKKPHRQLFILLNLSAKPQSVQLKGNDFAGDYREVFTGQAKTWKPGEKINMTAWEYMAYESEQ